MAIDSTFCSPVELSKESAEAGLREREIVRLG
jgi:hypothetical protein